MKRLYEACAYTPEWPDSHWRRSLPLPAPSPALNGDATAEVAIIGAGFAGLSAAHELAGRFGADVAVLEAVQPGWGASGRNGGFCCLGGSKLSDAAIARRVGDEGARAFRAFQSAAIETVDEVLDRHGIDARQGPVGETYLAHSPAAFAALRTEAGPRDTLFGPSELATAGLSGPAFHGALQVAEGFPLHPLAYVEGLARVAIAAGARVYGDSPVTGIAPQGNGWRLTTPGGTLTAGKLLVATNGYSSEDLPPWLGGRTLPAQSSIFVTRQLSAAERADQGFTSPVMACDTRTALHYFRHLPDGRFLFGMRGGTSAAPEAMAATEARARVHFDTMFPAWAGVPIESHWAGFVCLTGGLAPFVGAVPGAEGMFAALGWHGSGVAAGSLGGRLAARLIAGAGPTIPALMARPPRRFPLPALRRLSLALGYRAAEWRDGALGRGAGRGAA